MPKDLFQIEILELHWKKDMPEQLDRCAHGNVRVKIGDEIIVDQQPDGEDWTLSAMALHLLRTLEKDHHPDHRVGEHLIPHCGFHIDHLDNESDVHLQGCFEGVNFWITHQEDKIKITTESGTSTEVSIDGYKGEVLKFSDKIMSFYQSSKPKQLPQDEYDRKGYNLFLQEWNRRRQKWGN